MISVQWIAVEAIGPGARNRRGRGNALSLPGQARPLGELSRTSFQGDGNIGHRVARRIMTTVSMA
jgi:hypothetical protein